MGYLSDNELRTIGFKRLGNNVKVSIKASVYDAERIELGDNVRVDDFCILSGRLVLGRNVHVAPFCLLAGGECGIYMGDFSGLAYHVQVFSQSDDYIGDTLTNPTIPDRFKKETKAAVNLGRHVIVGAGSIVFPGVDVAEGCSIGAMSLVNKSTTSWGVYLGNPARRIKNRSKSLLDLELEYLRSERAGGE